MGVPPIWNNREAALVYLRRYEEAIRSHDKALEFKPDKDNTWHNRGVALLRLGRYQEAIVSYDKALECKPDDPHVLYNKSCCYALQNQVQLAIEHLQQAINFDPQYQESAKTDTDFDNIREHESFQALLIS